MKKLVLFLIVAVLIVMTLPVAAHDEVTYAEWGTPTIDAVKEDVWNNAQSIVVADEANGDASTLGQQSTAVVYSLWDGEFIYFYAVVTDPTVDAVLRDDAWNQDAVGFMVDFGYVREPEVSFRDLGDDSYAGYVNVPAVNGDANYPEQPTIFGVAGYSEKVTSQCRVTDTGYEIEIAIPLLYKNYVPGDKIGYEIFLNNAIGEGDRYGFSVWNNQGDGAGGNSWQYSYNMGTLIFNPKLEPVVEEAPAAVEEAAPVAEAAPAAAPAAVPAAAAAAPQTSDFGIIAVVASLVSLAGYAVSKKRR